ncbi:hypothetical protein ACFV7Q_36780 [Streptomyces sp. NPDC059851]|uniref:hypothetical protein n=1 Tax=Streptomyces sp. NPDC059851 TaxID=3346971 RepID=UPI0036585127
MKIELSDVLDELVELQEAEDEARAEVDLLQEELGDVSQWTDEQSVAWTNAWEDWRVPTEELDMALNYYAEKIGRDRGELEAEVRKAAGLDPLPVED